MKAVYICFIYAIHIFIVYWLVTRFLEKSKNFIVNIIMIMLIVFWLMCPACSMRAKRHVYSASHVRCTQTHHHRANHLPLEKDYLRVEKRLFMAWKDYLWVEKDYLRLWPSFCKIVSLFLITWHTFNQSMDKNIWMPYITIASFYVYGPLTTWTSDSTTRADPVRGHHESMALWSLHIVLVCKRK